VTSGGLVTDIPVRPNEPTLRWRSRAHSIEEVEQELARIWAQSELVSGVDLDGDHVNERHIGARTHHVSRGTTDSSRDQRSEGDT